MAQVLSIIQNLIILQWPTIFLAILTAFYVILTHKMLVQMRIAREPIVCLDIENRHAVYTLLIIGNFGLSPAKNVLIQCNVDKVPWHDEPKGVLGNNKKMEIPFITPGKKLHYFLGAINIAEFRKEGGFISFVVSYQNESGKKYKHEVSFDLGGYLSTISEEFETPLSNIAKALQSLVSEKRSGKLWKEGMRMTEKKICPYCGEFIQIVAKKCPHCLEFLDIQKSKSNKKTNRAI